MPCGRDALKGSSEDQGRSLEELKLQTTVDRVNGAPGKLNAFVECAQNDRVVNEQRNTAVSSEYNFAHMP